MKIVANLSRTFGVGCIAAALAAAVVAQSPPVSDAGVARLSVVEGSVSTQRGSGSDWTAAAVNAPMLGGDSVATSDGRAEVQLDFANLIRLDGNAQATIAGLTRSQIQIQVGQGLVNYVVLRNAESSAEVDTPNVAVHPHGPGDYRVQVNSDSESLVIVRSGQAEVSTPQGSTTLYQGQMITVEGTDNPQYQVADAPGRDGFDDWNQSRDRQEENAESWSHANHYYTGVNDLDAYGHWVFVPGYGQVWSPAEAGGWVPYSAGRWVSEPGWGWTWVSSEPWGWAPYHYGRWFYYQTGWVWWPGPVAVTPRYRPVWAPAYVSFVGLHVGGVSVGVGFGSVGWVPVGPADPYRPWWGGREASRVNVTNINVTNVNVTNVNVTNVRVVQPLMPVGEGRAQYSNLSRMSSDPHVAAAVVSVRSDQFGHGEVVRQRVSVNEIRQGQVMGGALPMQRTKESMRVSDRAVNVAALPRAATAPPQRFYSAAGPRPAVARMSRNEYMAARPEAARGENANRLAPAGGDNANRPGPARVDNASRPAPAAGNAAAARPGYQRFGDNSRPSGVRPNQEQPQPQPAARGASGFNSNHPAPAANNNATPRPDYQ
ncbi:MAG: DUF6600 domain-containing protein, partial [Terriglobales bacterium]